MIRILFILLLSGVKLLAQKPEALARKADQFYQDSSFQMAEENYRKAHSLKPDFKNQYNIANSLYMQGRAEEAKEHYLKSLQQPSAEKENHSSAWHNLGNSYYHTKDYQKSVDAYKNALKQNPQDLESKINLAHALKQLKIQQQQQQQQQQDQQQQQQQQQQDQKQQDQQKQDQQKQDQQKQTSEEKEKQNPTNQKEDQKLNKDQADQIMKMVDQQDEKVKEKMKNASGKKKSKEKDW